MEQTNLAGRVAIVTGAGDGLGKAEAIRLAAKGASVVINDIDERADEVAKEIIAVGGTAIGVQGDISQWNMGDELVNAAVDTYGSLDIVVNNAGIIRDTMIFNLEESQWDTVLNVHLKGHAALSRATAAYFRSKSKEIGGPINGRIINTASEAGLMGSAGQPNYSAAKAGIIALTLSTAQGLAKYGVTANAIAPRARTGMTSNAFAEDTANRQLDSLSPERVARFVSYLASDGASVINGNVFVVYSDFVALLKPATVEHKFVASNDVFTEEELAAQFSEHFAERSPYASFAAYNLAKLDNTGLTPVV